jgi:trk system potassium uptake protein TrkH
VEFRRWLLPRSAVTEPVLWHGESCEFLTDRRLRQVAMFVFVYVVVFFLGSGLVAAHGYALDGSLFEFASALSTVGISVGITSASAPANLLWVEMGSMILGRLEFFAVVVGLAKILGDTPALIGSRPPNKVTPNRKN